MCLDIKKTQQHFVRYPNGNLLNDLSFLYCTYPRDRNRARMDALIESDVKPVEEKNSVAIDEHSPVRVFVFTQTK